MIYQDFTTWTYKDSGSTASCEYEHGGYDAITTSASESCIFCTFFVDSLPSHAIQAKETRSNIKCTFPKTQYGQLNLVFKFAPVEHNHRSVLGWKSFEIFQALDLSQRTTGLVNNIALPQQLSRAPKTASCVSLARSWIQECVQHHDKCIRPKEASLPTRLLDVGDGQQDPRLVTSRESMGEYLALSYCWGFDRRLVTTAANLEDHKAGVQLKKLPQTLKHAVLMTRWLGYRFLWIDALCIIQDDDVDWRREAASMCSVYEHAVCSLAVLDAEGSDVGFSGRQEDDFEIVDMDGLRIGIREPKTSAQIRLAKSRLETRAWTLQERILAPSVLYIGNDQIFWECCTGLASEACPVVCEEPPREDWYSGEGRSVHEMKLLLRNDIRADAPDLWHSLVESYTQRLHTHASDRLPAIQGLATKLDQHNQGKYIFGMWSDSLHISLLWKLSLDRRLPVRTARERRPNVPTWSWASYENPVVFICKSMSHITSRIDTEADLLRINTVRSEDSSSVACLRVKAQYQKGTCIRSDRKSRSCEFKSEISDSFLDRAKCTLDNVSNGVRGGEPLWGDFYCVLVAERAKGAEAKGARSTSLFCLILKEVQNDHHYDTFLPVLRRAGVGELESAVASQVGVVGAATYGEFVLI